MTTPASCCFGNRQWCCARSTHWDCFLVFIVFVFCNWEHDRNTQRGTTLASNISTDICETQALNSTELPFVPTSGPQFRQLLFQYLGELSRLLEHQAQLCLDLRPQQ